MGERCKPSRQMLFMHLSKKDKVPSIVQYNIFKTLCLSIKNNKLLFHNTLSQGLHCTLTTRITWTFRYTALLTRPCPLHSVIEHVRALQSVDQCNTTPTNSIKRNQTHPRDRPRRQTSTANSMVEVISHPSSRGCCCCCCCKVNVFRFCVFPISKER